MSRNSDADAQLRHLVDAVRGAYRNFLAKDSPWPAAFFSDTFVAASPVGHEPRADEVAVAELVEQAAWLQLDLLDRGFFVRGAVTLGPFYIQGGLVFGPALIEAYELERDAAVHPRIVLGPRAEEAQRQAASAPESAAGLQSQPLLCDDDGRVFVDYLRVLLEDPQDPTPALKGYRDAVATRLQEHRRERHIWEKYRWVAEYHNQILAAQPPKIASLAVPIELITRRFLPLA